MVISQLSHSCRVGGVCLLVPSGSVSQLIDSGCVIVTFKLLDGDFISLFPCLIPFFYTAFDNNEKIVMFFLVFYLKGKHWC